MDFTTLFAKWDMTLDDTTITGIISFLKCEHVYFVTLKSYL